MQRAMYAVLGAALVVVATAGFSAGDPTFDPRAGFPAPAAEGNGLISHVTATDGQPLVVTVVDPRQRWIGVYHVDHASGEITWKSGRNISYDQQLIEYNSGKPLATEVRSGLSR